MENYLDKLIQLSSCYSDCTRHFIPSDQRLMMQKSEMQSSLLQEMKQILERLSLSNCGSDTNRFLILTALDKCDRNTDGRLSDSIKKVIGKVVLDGRAKFQGFCESHKIEDSEKIQAYSRCIDFRRPYACVPLTRQDVMYQWCMFNTSGEMVVGQWFTKEEVEPYKLGVSWSCDVYTKGFKVFNLELFKRYQGVGTRVLCEFNPFLECDGFISAAHGAYDSWSSVDLGKPGQWSDGGAVQYFVPLSDDDKKALCAIAKPIRQWNGD